MNKTAAIFLRFAICAIVVGVVDGPAPFPRTVAQAAKETTGEAANSRVGYDQGRGVTEFRGRRLSYEVVEGMAIHAGDMILGTAEEITEATAGPQGRPPEDDWPRRRDLSSVDADRLWPDGIVPYVIDANVPEREAILSAISEWNSKTVIRLVERKTEVDYVRFRAVSVGNCRSYVGMMGGEQYIDIPPKGCQVNAAVHEIGHAVGLWHEHQRVDRDTYLTVHRENLGGKAGLDNVLAAEHPASGPYDFASTMHYHSKALGWGGEAVMESIPPGLSIPSGELSAGDIDGLARLYGQPPATTTVSTNPPGLEIIVDGVRVTAPKSFAWAPGSSHLIEAPVAQVASGSRYLFGRWNDNDGGWQYAFRADPSATWIEANFIVQHHVAACADPIGAGEVRITPESADGYYTLRTPITVEASPDTDGSYQFQDWISVLWGDHGRSANPALSTVTRPDLEYRARFSRDPLFRIDSQADPIAVFVNGEQRLAPIALDVRRLADRIAIQVPQEQAIRESYGARYRFESWSDGGAIAHRLRVPRSGGSLVLRTAAEYRLTTAVEPPGSGAIWVAPSSPDGFYSSGTRVRVTALPSPGWEFADWTGRLSGSAVQTTVDIDGPVHAEAVCSRTRELHPGQDMAFVLPAKPRYRWHVYEPEHGFRIRVPAGADELAIHYRPEALAPGVAFFAQLGTDRWRYGPGPDRDPEVDADYRSVSTAFGQSLSVTPDSDPPLEEGIYFIRFLRFRPGQDIRGTIMAEVRGGGADAPRLSAKPQAMTFVAQRGSEAPSQSIRLANEGRGPLRFRFGSGPPWLRTNPSEGLLAEGETLEIEVTASRAGLYVGTYRAELEVAASTERSPVATAEQAIRIHVFHVAAPRLASRPRTQPDFRIQQRRGKGRIDFVGDISYSYGVDGLSISIERLRNRSSESTGPLRALLFATRDSKLLGSKGFVLGDASFAEQSGNEGRLRGSGSFEKVALTTAYRPLPADAPPGAYKIHLIVSESQTLDAPIASVEFNGGIVVCD